MKHNAVVIFVVALALHDVWSPLQAALAEDTPIVQLSVGKVQGTVLPVGDQGSVHLYQGIRYGKYFVCGIPYILHAFFSKRSCETIREAGGRK